MTTIGGVAFRHLDHLPVVGDQVKVEGITITVVEMDVHRIAKVRVSSTGSGDQKIVTNEDQQENKSDGTEKGEIKPSEEAEAKSEQPETDSVQPDFAVSPTDIEQENTLTDGNVSAVLELAENSTTMESQQTSTEWQDGEPEKVISNNQEEQLSGKLNPETAVASTGQKR
jgi:hypothetical protein